MNQLSWLFRPLPNNQTVKERRRCRADCFSPHPKTPMAISTPAKVTAWSSAKQGRPGDRVRVVAGQLAGLTGVVCNTDGANALFTADGLKGIYVRMSIEKLEEQLREKPK
jgi:hypothetical protein